MKTLTKKQKNIISIIEEKLSIQIIAQFTKRNVIAVQVPDTCDLFESAYYRNIETFCKKYDLGKVESCGYKKMAIIIN